MQKLPGEELTFDSMKRILTECNNNQTEDEEKRVNLSECFRNAPFRDLVTKTQPKVSQRFSKLSKSFISKAWMIHGNFFFQHDVLQTKLSDIFNSLTIETRNLSQQGIQPIDSKPSQIPSYELHFPELFVY